MVADQLTRLPFADAKLLIVGIMPVEALGSAVIGGLVAAIVSVDLNVFLSEVYEILKKRADKEGHSHAPRTRISGSSGLRRWRRARRRQQVWPGRSHHMPGSPGYNT